MWNTIDNIQVLSIRYISENRGELSVVQGNDIPYKFNRVFSVKANNGEIRGNHAHKKCKQFMLCLNGKLEIICDDGISQKTFTLTRPNKGILIPDGIWATQKYLMKNTVLMVLCDLNYDENDYIRNYNNFIKYIKMS